MAGGMMQKPRFNDSIICAFTNFSDDILFTIFLKLPVKSVVCGRCFCKSWRQSLFDPNFIKMHVNRTNQDHQSHEKLFLMSSSNSFYSVDLETSNAKAVPRNFPSKSTIDIEIVGSCNGLLCLFVPARKQPSRYEQLLKLVLWNPSTGDYKNLPAVDPSVQNSHTVGFGYDASLDDYKMVRICEIDSKYRVDMYSLKANSWKIIGNLPDLTEILNHPQPGFCLNGSIYWMGNHNFVCFDLKNEKFREVQWIHDMNHQWFNTHLSVIGGYLCLHYIGENGELVMWELKEDHDNKAEWVKLMTIPSKTRAQMAQPATCKLIRPVCFLENGKVLFSTEERISDKTSERIFLLEVDYLVHYINLVVKFVVYDPKMSTTVQSFPLQGVSDDKWKYVTYKESLVSPNFV
ncbi:hypothetical protein LguiA_030548 [Lonicera macranthoides]